MGPKAMQTLDTYKPIRHIHRTWIILGMLIGLMALAQGSAAFGAIRWGGAVLRQQPQWYSSVEARAVADSVILY